MRFRIMSVLFSQLKMACDDKSNLPENIRLFKGAGGAKKEMMSFCRMPRSTLGLLLYAG